MIRIFGVDRYDGVCSLPTVDAVDQLPEISISGRVEPVLPVDAVVKGNQRMGKGLLLNEIGNVPGLCLGLAQEAAAYRNASKKIADNDSGSIRRPDLLEVDPDRGIRGVGCQMVVDRPGSQKAFPDLGDHFHLGNSRDTGEGLAAESQRGQMGQISGVPDLAGGVAHKSAADLVLFDTAAVVCDPYHTDPAVSYLNGDGSCPRVDRIFHQLLDNVERPLYDLSR